MSEINKERYEALVDYFLQIKQKEHEISLLKTKLDVLLTTEEEKDPYENVAWDDFQTVFLDINNEWLFCDDSLHSKLIIEYKDIKIELSNPLKTSIRELFLKILDAKNKKDKP